MFGEIIFRFFDYPFRLCLLREMFLLDDVKPWVEYESALL